MAVARMRKVTILAFKELQDDLLEKLRDLEIMQVTKMGPVGESSEGALGEVDAESEAESGALRFTGQPAASLPFSQKEASLEYSERISKLIFIKSYFERYSAIRKGFIDMFTGRKPEVTRTELEDLVQRYDIDATFQTVTRHDERLKEIGKEISDIDTQVQTLSPWKALDIPIGHLGTTLTCESFLAVIPSGKMQAQLQEVSDKAVYYEVLWEEKGQAGLWVLALKDEFPSPAGFISSLGGTVVDLQRLKGFGHPE